MFLIHNATRDIDTRAARATSSRTGGMSRQFILKATARLVHGRPVAISEQQLSEHREELLKLQEQGKIKVTTFDRRKVDMRTLEIAPAAGEPATPNFLLDDVNRDLPHAHHGGRGVDQEAPPEDFQMPVPPPEAVLENPLPGTEVAVSASEEKVAEEVVEEVAEEAPPAPPLPVPIPADVIPTKAETPEAIQGSSVRLGRRNR